jgi:hypothetical protein
MAVHERDGPTLTPDVGATPCALHGAYPPGSRLAVEYPPGWPISLAGAVVIRTICGLPIICDFVTLVVAIVRADLPGRACLAARLELAALVPDRGHHRRPYLIVVHSEVPLGRGDIEACPSSTWTARKLWLPR